MSALAAAASDATTWPEAVIMVVFLALGAFIIWCATR